MSSAAVDDGDSTCLGVHRAVSQPVSCRMRGRVWVPDCCEHFAVQVLRGFAQCRCSHLPINLTDVLVTVGLQAVCGVQLGNRAEQNVLWATSGPIGIAAGETRLGGGTSIT
jgi:hypothetical protein